jgi:imidazolonepropionase
LVHGEAEMIEIWADEIVTPKSSGGVQRIAPARMTFNLSGITEVERLSRSKLARRSRKILRYQVITPGFVDAHTHLVFSGERSEEWNQRLKGVSYQEIAKKGGGIRRTMAATREATSRQLLDLAIRRAKLFLNFGVTTIEAKSGYGLSAESELKILHVTNWLRQNTPLNIVSTFMGAHAVPPEFTNAKKYTDHLIENVLPRVGSLASFQDVFCERGYFSEADAVRLLLAGKKFGLLPKIHAHEFGRTGGVRAAARAGAVSADHLMEVSAADIQLLKRAKVVPVVLPGTSFFLGAKKFAPARAMLRAGLPVAIASDFNPGTNPTQNFPLIGTFAAIYQALTLEEVLTAQTLNGARALRLFDRGTLEVGKRADFAIWDVSRFEEIYYSYGSSRVASLYLGGKKVL